jgi:hypothetical protein
MFQLVAVIFAVINGAPSDRPSRVFPYSVGFESMEACMDFAQTDEGEIRRNAINEFVQSQRGAITAKLGCAQVEDNSI